MFTMAIVVVMSGHCLGLLATNRYRPAITSGVKMPQPRTSPIATVFHSQDRVKNGAIAVGFGSAFAADFRRQVRLVSDRRGVQRDVVDAVIITLGR